MQTHTQLSKTHLKNRDIKPMKKYLIIILTLLFVGCSSIPIKSDNGSFRNSLKSEYYKKDNYILDTLSGSQVAGDIIGIFAFGLPLGSIAEYSKPRKMMNNVDIDEVIQHGRIAAYLLNIHAIRYIKLNKDGLRPNKDDDKLMVFFYRIYVDGQTRGFKIIIREEIVDKKFFNFITYQEISINKKGEFIIRENVSEKEAERKRIKWDDTRM